MNRQRDTMWILRRPAVVAAVMLIAVVATAQEGPVGPQEPDQTEIVVPELFLEVEEISVEQVDALLPAGEDLQLQSGLVPLPEPEAVRVIDVSVDLPQLQDPSLVGTTPGSSVYSTGQLGAGTMNHIMGSVSLYKLGDDPRFRLEFAHEGRDGFALEPAGTGYFSATNQIEGWVALGDERWDVEVQARYDERELGLQGVSNYYSADLRYIEGSGSVTYTPEPLVSLSAQADAAASTRLQTVSAGETAPRESEYYVAPEVSGRLSISVVSILLEIGYDGRWNTSAAVASEHAVDAQLGLAIELPNSLVIDGRAGAQWDIGETFLYPWYLGGSFAPTANLELNLGGGFDVEPRRLNALWKTTPLMSGTAAGGGGLQDAEVWHAEGGFRTTGAAGLFVDGRTRFEVVENAVIVGAYDEDVDLFPFSLGRLMTLRPRLLLGWQVSRALHLDATWEGAFIERRAYEPLSTIGAAVRVGSDDGRFGGSLDGTVDIYSDAVSMPELVAEGFFQASEGVEFVVRLQDALSPLLSDGRPSVGTVLSADYPFVEPGFSLSLLTRISL